MPGTRNAPAEKLYAWSNLYLGGESVETKDGRKIVSKQNIIPAGSEFDAGEFEVSEEDIQAMKDVGSLRPYPHPDGYEGEVTSGQSPYTYVVEKAREELESAEEDIDSESAEDRLIRASLAGSQVFGQNPEEILLGQEPEEEGVAEVTPAPASNKATSKSDNG